MKRLLALIPIAVACTWGLISFVSRPLSCNRSMARLQASTNLASETGDTYRATILARTNLAEMRRLEGPCRTTVNLYVLEANNFDVLGRKEDAIAALRRGLKVDQRPEIYFNIGTLLVELGRIDEAVENYVIAVRIAKSMVTAIPSPEARERVDRRLAQLAGHPPP